MIATLAWNLSRWVGLALPAEGRWTKKHAEEKTCITKMRFRTLVQMMMTMPAQVLRATGRPLARLESVPPRVLPSARRRARDHVAPRHRCRSTDAPVHHGAEPERTTTTRRTARSLDSPIPCWADGPYPRGHLIGASNLACSRPRPTQSRNCSTPRRPPSSSRTSSRSTGSGCPASSAWSSASGSTEGVGIERTCRQFEPRRLVRSASSRDLHASRTAPPRPRATTIHLHFVRWSRVLSPSQCLMPRQA